MQHGVSRWTAKRTWRLFVAAALVAATVIAGADAWAQQTQQTTVVATPQQPAPTPEAKTQQTIDCGTSLGDRNTCDADTSSGVVLLRQTGDGTCALGRTWGFDAKGVWVADGCRGTFAFTDDRTTVTCSAVADAREVCSANTAGGVALVTGSPACMLGRTWGYDKDGIWVSNGCQATFVLTTRGARECGSDGARQHCAADTSAGVVLARLTTPPPPPPAPPPCVLGESWGYDTTGVWVDKGCRAEFVLGNPDNGGQANKDLYDFFGLFEPYGRLRGHVAFFNDEIEVQDDASYVGMNFSTRGAVKFFATTEWGVSLVQGGQEFNAGGITSGGGYPNLENPQAGQVFGNRIGNVGLDFGAFGRIAVGKQWSVHSDVTLYTTDQFVVFGSQASATYTAGTDGGFLGTGRADQTLSYRTNIFNIVRLGGQVQFKTADNSEVIDGAGASLQLTLLPGVRVGAAYTKTLLGDDVKANIRGLDGDAKFVALGAQINWKVVEAAAVFARQNNGDLARVTFPDGFVESIAFDAEGVEALLRFNMPGFSIYGGYNYYRPKRRDLEDPIDPRFRKRYGIVGANMGIMRNMYAYAEARVFDESRGARGEEGFDVLAIGVHYGFSLKGFHRR
jgi:predicted porin